MKQNSQLRQLANLAKQRLKSGNYKDVTTLPANSFSSAIKASTYFMCNARALKREYIKAEIVPIDLRDQEFENKVINLLTQNELVFDAIGQLVDDQEFCKMNEFQKQQYVLNLSDKFNKVKQEFLINKNIA